MKSYHDRFSNGALVLIMDDEDYGTHLGRVERESGGSVAVSIGGGTPSDFSRSFQVKYLQEGSAARSVSQHSMREVEQESDANIVIEFLRSQCLQSHKYPAATSWHALKVTLGGRADIELDIGEPDRVARQRRYVVRCSGNTMIDVVLDSNYSLALPQIASLIQAN